jgi:hypothetical protein
MLMMWIRLMWLRQGPMVGSCENGNDISDATKGTEFLAQLRNY